MSLSTPRLATAGVLAAAAIVVPAAALASASPSGKPTAPPSAAAASKSAAAASKPAVNSSAAAAKSAAAASKSAAGPRNRADSMTGSAAVAALAGRLGISRSAARHALHQIVALSGQGGLDPADPAFGVIARDLGVSPAKLAAALGGVKQALAHN